MHKQFKIWSNLKQDLQDPNYGIQEAIEELEKTEMYDKALDKRMEGTTRIDEMKKSTELPQEMDEEDDLSNFEESHPITEFDEDDPLYQEIRKNPKYVKYIEKVQAEQEAQKLLEGTVEQIEQSIPNKNPYEYSSSNRGNSNETPLLKGSVEYTANPYEVIQNNPNLTPEEKVAQIEAVTKELNKEIDKKHLKKMIQCCGGFGLEMASYAIPGTIGAKAVGGIAKALSPVAKKLVPKIGKKYSQDLTKSIAEGLVSAPVASVGDELLKDEDIPGSIAKDSTKSVGQGVAFGSAYSWNKHREAGNEIKNIDKITDLPERQQRKRKDKAIQYYDDYIDGTQMRNLPRRNSRKPLTDEQWRIWKKILGLRK